ncbi:hypothetical protein SBRCBS47491_000534 [Sporothrix bragantina]|uniref:Uncharacterized protein n=1 Tax=Sporothrix bragantina TaxID=671064 RepID=A0ABP0AR22_9PEZI
MLVARDQENRVFGHSLGGPAGKNHALGPKTPGGKSFNTPMKVPLNDGNGTTRMAGKSVLGGRPGGNENMRTVGKGKNLQTPLESRTARAPLGNKTTNARAQAVQQAQQLQQQKSRAGGVKDIVREIEQSQKQQQRPMPQTGGRRPKAATPRANSFKLSVLNDAGVQSGSDKKDGHEEDIEYAPPRVPARPYESDVFPDGVLTFAAFQPQNRLRGVYDHYYNPVDETDGVPLRDKAFAEQQRRAFEKLDIRVQEDLDAFDWSIGDVPASKEYFANKRKQQQDKETSKPAQAPPPATIASRKAASALAVSSTKTNRPLGASTSALQTKAKAAPLNASSTSSVSTSLLSGLPLRKPRAAPTTTMPLRPKSRVGNVNHPVAETASRTTLGYNKGRTALSLVRGTAGAPRVPLSTVRSTATVKRVAPVMEAEEVSVATTPAPRTLQKQPSLGEMLGGSMEGPSAPRSPAFLSIFDVEEDEQDNLGGAGTFVNEDLDDNFQMDIKF